MRKLLFVLSVAILLTVVGLWFSRRHSVHVDVAEGASAVHETSAEAALSTLDSQAPRQAQPGVAAPPAVAPSGSESSHGSVRGRFVDELNAPVARVEVLRLLRRGETQALATSGDGGRFRFQVTGFTPWGKLGLTLCGKKQPYVPYRMEVVALKDQELDLGDLLLRPGGMVSGHVVDTTGLGIEGARVSCTNADWFDRERAPRVGPGRIIADTTSGAGGEFLLEGASPGQVRMWASKKGMRHAFGEPIEVRMGEETPGVVLVLETRSNADDFEIQVLKPDGSPCGGANIDFRYACPKAEGGRGNAFADESGHLTLTVWAACPYSFLAADPDGNFGSASSGEVMPGSGPIVLRLSERVPIRLHVVDERGGAIETFRVRLVDPKSVYRDVGAPIEEEKHPNGVLELAAPSVPFLVTVEAEEFESARFGPYEPGTIPREIEAKLVRLGGISGRVVASGNPVESARVELYRAAPENLTVAVHEFTSRYRVPATATDQSRDGGAFHLPLRNAGRYFIRAEKAGWASTESGPLELDPKVRMQDIELVLTPGGAIEGHLLLPAGESPVGAVVGISRGDAAPRTLRIGSDGSFRFEHLTPGRWLVKRCVQEISQFVLSSGEILNSQPVETPWNCEVVEGVTTRFDIDLSVDRRASLLGRLLITGKPAGHWRVCLLSSSAQTLVSDVVETDAKGEFVLSTAEPGSYSLSAHGTLDDTSEIGLAERLDLVSGKQSWTREIHDFGRVAGKRASGEVPSQSAPYLQWIGPGELRAVMKISIDDQGQFALPLVPSGPCKIRAWTMNGELELASFDVRAGETTTVALP